MENVLIREKSAKIFFIKLSFIPIADNHLYN
jgi:hypothetical protein